MCQESECRFESLIDLPRELAFSLFVDQPALWWPFPFKQSNPETSEVAIEPFAGGTCYDTDLEGKHRIWGTVLSIEEPLYIRLAWQVTQGGEQEPDPSAASRVMVNFRASGNATRIEVVHKEFLRHGEQGSNYLQYMSSDQGWPRILRNFVLAARREA